MIQKRDPYVRPNNHWVCGGTNGECDQCPGPISGRCPAQPRCRPIKTGEKWVATLDPKLGTCVIGPLPDGQCCQGPGVCSPRPSLRSYRTAFICCCAALTIAGLLCSFAQPWRAEFLAPGPLTSHHAQVLKGEGIDRCAACHEAAGQPISQWLASTFGVGHHATNSQPQLCLKCHGEQIPPSLALAAHNLDPAVLDQYTSKLSGTAIPNTASDQQPIACSTCHREHHGPDNDLSHLTDQQCQTCHSTQFHSFESNHLEFPTTYPARRRSRIAFDHVGHKSVHFVAKNKGFDCRSCHVGDALQNVQLLSSYEKTCQECHQQQILKNESLTLLSLPLIDIEAIRKSGSAVPDWPISVSGQFDGRIPPLMQLLLAADPQVHAALDQLSPGFQFSDIDNSNSDQVRLAAVVATGIKALIDELATDAQGTLRRRIAQSLGCAENASPLNDWLATVPVDALKTLKATWFAQDASPTGGRPSRSVSSAWLPGDGDVLARLATVTNQKTSPQDSDELVPNPLKGIAKPATGQAPGQIQAPNAAPQNPTAADSRPAPNQSSDVAESKSNSTIPDDELLAVNPLRSGNLPPAQILQTPDELAQSERPPLDSNSDSDAKGMKVTQVALATGEGWQVDGVALSVSYRPVRHFDESLRALITLVASSENKQSIPAAKQLFQPGPVPS